MPGNLMPQVSQVAIGHLPILQVFGNDYETYDGTTVRDYLHVMDLATAQINALEGLDRHRWIRVNLGTGRGVCGKGIPYVFAPRRPGDISQCYANAELALKDLQWRAKRTLEEMCKDTWLWQSRNSEHNNLAASKAMKATGT